MLMFQIGEVNVSRVLRRGPKAIHVTDGPLNEGDDLKCCIDWERRFDHMQQHSGNLFIYLVLAKNWYFCSKQKNSLSCLER